MAQIDLSKAYSKLEFKGFKGIDRASSVFGEGLEYIDNFRIGADGSISKRCGFAHQISLPDSIRALTVASDSTLLALAGNKIYLLSPSEKSYSELASVNTSEGDASFFRIGGEIYLADGTEIYSIGDSGALPIQGYVPLYGRDWDPHHMGDVYEPLNVLSARIRLSYKIGSYSPSYFLLPFKAVSLDSFLLNGVSQPLSHLLLSSGGLSLQPYADLNEGDTVTVSVTLASPSGARSLLAACKRAVAFGDPSGLISVAFFDGADPSALYCAHVVRYNTADPSASIYPDALPLYATENSVLSIDNGRSTIISACEAEDGLMIFTSERGFFLSVDESGVLTLSLIPSAIGCLSKNGLIFSGGFPVTVSRGGVFKWSASSRRKSDLSAVCLSSPINNLLSHSLCTRSVAYLSKCTNEIIICDPSDALGTAFVYSIDGDRWYAFSGIGAEHLFELSGTLGFSKANAVYTFDPDISTDVLEDGERPIVSRLESGIIMHKPLNEKKRLSQVIMLTSPSADLKFAVTDSDGRTQEFYLSDTSSERLGYIEKRLDCRRARYFSFSIENSSSESISIYALVLTAID